MDTPTLPLLRNFKWAFVWMDPVNVPAKFEVHSFTHSWDNIRGSLKRWAVPSYAHTPFSKNFFVGFCQIWSP